jgi:hypothetical protein
MWLFWSLDESGIRRIYTWAQNTEFKCKLVVVVYPACPTGYLDLEELLQLRQNTEGKLDFRLYVTNSTRGGISSSIFELVYCSDSCVGTS